MTITYRDFAMRVDRVGGLFRDIMSVSHSLANDPDMVLANVIANMSDLSHNLARRVNLHHTKFYIAPL